MAVRWCPLCRRGDLRRHCHTSPTCTWEKCPKCRATFAPLNRRAYDHDGQPLTWPTAWPKATP